MQQTKVYPTVFPLRAGTHPGLPSREGVLHVWRTQSPLPFEGADLRTDGSPDSEQTEPAKP